MKRLAIAIVTAATLLLSWPSLSGMSSSGSAAVDETVVLNLGDRVQVAGAPIGCRVTRLAQHGEQVFLDCRRAGRLAGTYGTYLSGRDVLVTRFRSSQVAKVVFRARHEGGSQRCN
jgi:hypothetical protein